MRDNILFDLEICEAEESDSATIVYADSELEI